MAMDFPTSPTNGQVFTSGGVVYTWNGYAWVGGGIPAAGADAPSDGGEYVRVNGVWRLKSQSIVLTGAGVDVSVPAGARIAVANIVAYLSVATDDHLVARVSWDGTTFPAGATDYYYYGFVHNSGSLGYASFPQTSFSAMILGPHSHNSPVHPIMANTTFQLIRPSNGVSISWVARTVSQVYNEAAGLLLRSGMVRAIMYPAAYPAGQPLDLKKLRFFLFYQNFGAGSTLNIDWQY